MRHHFPLPSVATSLLTFCLVAALHSAAPYALADYTWSEKITELQIFLDRANFGPGKIDGQPGEFTDKALAAYKKSHEEEKDGKLKLPKDTPLFTTRRVTDSDLAQVGPMGINPEEQSKQKSMPYASLPVAIAERYHTDIDFLRALNKDRNLDELKVGDEVKVPNVPPFEIEKVKLMATFPASKALLKQEIIVDTAEKSLGVYKEGKLVALFPISPGSDKLPAPKGEWKIESVTTLPVFRWDEKMLKEGVRSEEFFLIQPGPANPVGVLWIQLLDKPGIGIHGTNQPDTIGRSSSHGCIRLANWDAVKLSGMVTAGGSVVIR